MEIRGIFFRKTRRELESLRQVLHRREAELQKERRVLDDRSARLDQLLRNKVEAYEHIANAWAEWEIALAQSDEHYLRKKKHPAPTAAELVRERGRELAEVRRRLKLADYITAFYEWHAPWLTELRDIEADLDYVNSASDPSEAEDPAARYLSIVEYRALSPAERNQRALDRYLRSHLTPWQLGRDYERYVGYLREQEGCQVTYHGIVKGLEDLGRDILAERDGTIEVIQCKRWAQHKLIHEKHVFQLFGTVTAARVENVHKSVTGTFVTTTTLSDRAREFARVLGIRVEEDFRLADYPRIKCNIARATGERIYHLPFDQQYDATLIEPARGECYVSTCAEAEALGFRRAWRWRTQEKSPPG